MVSAGATSLKVGDRPLTELPAETPKLRAFDKQTGDLVWEKEVPDLPAPR